MSTTSNEILNAVKGNNPADALKNVGNMFGIRSFAQLKDDVSQALSHQGSGFQVGLSSLGFIRPDISIPTYKGKRPANGLSPIYHCFDRVGGGKNYSQRVTRKNSKDFREKNLTYDEHDGVDFVCPIGTELVAAAPGRVVMIRDTWLRGGLTIAVDHGDGFVTQYTHCWKPLVSLGQEIKRGEPVALSGASGLDMTLFFPWIPAHIHFMIWKDGMPIDPFYVHGQKDRSGTWFDERGTGMPGHDVEGVLSKEGIPEFSTVNVEVIDALIPQCLEQRVKDQMAELTGNYPALAALLEDSLHHDNWAWPEQLRRTSVRLEGSEKNADLRLTLPLTSALYQGAFFADEKVRGGDFWE